MSCIITIPTQTYIAFAYKSIAVQELLSTEFQRVLFHFSEQLKNIICVSRTVHFPQSPTIQLHRQEEVIASSSTVPMLNVSTWSNKSRHWGATIQ